MSFLGKGNCLSKEQRQEAMGLDRGVVSSWGVACNEAAKEFLTFAMY